MQLKKYCLKDGALTVKENILKKYSNFDLRLEFDRITFFENNYGVIQKRNQLKIKKQWIDMCKIKDKVNVLFHNDKIEVFSTNEESKKA